MYESTISVEEYYEYSNRHTLVKCDVCKSRIPATRVYTMQRFQDDTELILCAHCIGQLRKQQEAKTND